METVRVACRAMATRFEIVLQGEDPARLRAAGEEALAEIQHLEAQLSFYRPTSALSRLNAKAAQTPVKVEARMFRLLQRAKALHAQTSGAFDPTVAPLMRCWGFVNNTGQFPSSQAIDEALAQTGMHHVRLEEKTRHVTFEHSGIALDLGGIGKGFALEEAAWVLRDLGVERALLHGGTSTICALGAPEGEEAWYVALPYPDEVDSHAPESVITVVALCDEALSVSAEHGKAFIKDGTTYGHVLDPRTGWPVDGAAMAAVVAADATATDALSTALLVEGENGQVVLDASPTTRSAMILCHAADATYDVYLRDLSVQPDPVRVNQVVPI